MSTTREVDIIVVFEFFNVGNIIMCVVKLNIMIGSIRFSLFVFYVFDVFDFLLSSVNRRVASVIKYNLNNFVVVNLNFIIFLSFF